MNPPLFPGVGDSSARASLQSLTYGLKLDASGTCGLCEFQVEEEEEERWQGGGCSSKPRGHESASLFSFLFGFGTAHSCCLSWLTRDVSVAWAQDRALSLIKTVSLFSEGGGGQDNNGMEGHVEWVSPSGHHVLCTEYSSVQFVGLRLAVCCGPPTAARHLCWVVPSVPTVRYMIGTRRCGSTNGKQCIRFIRTLPPWISNPSRAGKKGNKHQQQQPSNNRN